MRPGVSVRPPWLASMLPLLVMALWLDGHCSVQASALHMEKLQESAQELGGGGGVAKTVCCGHEDHRFACMEMVRYLYLSSGYLPGLEMMSSGVDDDIIDLGLGDVRSREDSVWAMPELCKHDAVVLLDKTHPYVKHLEDVRDDIKGLGKESHHTRRTQWAQLEDHHEPGSNDILTVIGGGHEGVKHGAYELLERYGVHFRIEGDILPSRTSWSRQPHQLLNVRTTGTPTFDIRGLQPFHDFPEGPDWWGESMYKAIFSQLSKMRMNFLGLHTYPYSTTPGTGRDEPTVWVGLKEDVNEDGTVKASYPTSYANTMRNQWGDSSLPTGNYHYGAKDMYQTDCFGSEVQVGNCPIPNTTEGNNEVFDRTGAMLKSAFQHAQRISVKTCVGTETPLSMPSPAVGNKTGNGPLNLYYSASRKDHFLTTTQCAECEGVYVFVGVQGYISLVPQPGLIPVNTYYNGQKFDNVLSTKPIGPGYGLVRTEGYINATLLKSSNGDEDITSGLDMTRLQVYYNEQMVDHLVAGSDAAKKYALANGYVLQSTLGMVIANFTAPPIPQAYDYYEGIFTRIMKLQLPIDYYWIWTPEGWEWGKMNENNTVFQKAVGDLKSALAARDDLKAPFELASCGWVVGPLPDRSIFDKVLPSGYDAITSIDMAVGNTPVDKAYMNITHHKKWAIPWMEDDPGLTAPELWVNRTLMHMEDAATYGCNGLLGIHWRTKAVSPQILAMGMKSWDPTLTSDTFWTQWSKTEFGIEDPAAIFISIDSFHLPRPVAWSGGPGGWKADLKECGQAKTYAFVDELAAMKTKVQGLANIERFDYWLNSFLYMRGISATECAWGGYDAEVAKANKITDATQRATYARDNVLPMRVQLVANASQTITYLLQTVISPGEMGTVMNVLSHSLVHAIDEQTAALEAMLKPVMASLPPNAIPSDEYTGPSRLIVPAVRTHLTGGEPLAVSAMLLLTGSPAQTCNVTLNWKAVTGQAYETVAMTNVGRQVYQGSATISTAPTSSTPYEYYISAKCPSIGTPLYWPVTAPVEPQTLLVG
eukprot:scpid25772/ scgid27766/ 